jgi:MerR family mercuric resistance operon transcriptional regulator
MRRQAKYRALSAAMIKTGRYGSKAVRFATHAPEMPSVINIKGPRQQAEARSAKIPPIAKGLCPDFEFDICIDSFSNLVCYVKVIPVANYGVKRMLDKANFLTIGGLAKAAGVHIETIRYYQRRGLLAEPKRPPGGTRRYGSVDISRLRFVKTAQQLGFSLEEISNLLQLEDGAQCENVSALAEEKLKVVRAKITSLRKIETVLDQMIDRCHAHQGHTKCPLIASLHDGIA